MTVKLTAEQQARADKLARMTPAEWDAICKRCGICCLIKLKMLLDDGPRLSDARTIYMKRCCEKFNPKTRMCSMYGTRLSNPTCSKVDMDVVLNGELLPASCGYVEYVFGPASFPPRVDFSQVRPISDAQLDSMSDAELMQETIGESLFWSAHRR